MRTMRTNFEDLEDHEPSKAAEVYLGEWLVPEIENKVVCVFLKIVVFILPRGELGPNDHLEDAPHFTIVIS